MLKPATDRKCKIEASWLRNPASKWDHFWWGRVHNVRIFQRYYSILQYITVYYHKLHVIYTWIVTKTLDLSTPALTMTFICMVKKFFYTIFISQCVGIGINHAAAQPIKRLILIIVDIDSNSTFKTVPTPVKGASSVLALYNWVAMFVSDT